MKQRLIRLLLLLFFVPASVLAQEIKPVDLRTEYTENPLGIDESAPRFSWGFRQGATAMQSAYEIIIGDNLAQVTQGKGNAWEPGKIQSGMNTNIAYAGAALKPFTRYFWKVRFYDQDGQPSSWSDPAWFETAMLKPSDWQAKWISDGSRNPERDEDAYKPDRMPLLRKDFGSGKAISSARLYISGVGYFEAFVNGRKAGDHVLDPGWTTYAREVLYVTHDITSLVKSGRNTIGVMLGNGWWNPLPIKLFGRWDLREVQETGRPCVKAEVHIRYTDGSVSVIPTDETWITAPGPVIQNNVYLGEQYDARLEHPKWNLPEGSVKNWTKAQPVNGPSGKLSAQRQPPVKIMEVIKAQSVTRPAADTFVIDFGQNFAGVARIKVRGPAGRKIRIRYGENIFKDGTLNWSTGVMTQIRKGGIVGGPGAPATAWQEDTYILKGQGVEVWAPKFTFHGFRYIEVTGWPGTPTVDNFDALKLHAALREDGTFESSNQMFNDLQKVTKRTFMSNVFSVQSDCPAREKMGYGADIVVTANAFIYNYNMANFYRKAVQDFANDQQPDGGITEISPFTGIADRGYGGNSGPLGWQLAFPFVQKQLYDYYGDKRIIEENYDRFVRQMDFLREKAVNGLFHWDIGDHEALDPRAEAFSAACFYYHHALLATEFASILGKAEDSVRFAKLAANTKRLIVRKYHIPNTGRFDNGTQAAQIFALWYELSPEEEGTFDALMKEFERHNWHVSSGIYGVKMMFDVLRERNRNDVAFRLANQRDFPGWGFMLAEGATTLWESWEYPERYPSQNHPMFGSISEWFYRSLLGINPGAPGFSKVIIKPQPAGDLTWAKGSYQSVQGKISSAWKLEGDKFTLSVTIPGNTTAEVWVPGKEGTSLLSGGKAVGGTRYKNGYFVVDSGPGEFVYTTMLK